MIGWLTGTVRRAEAFGRQARRRLRILGGLLLVAGMSFVGTGRIFAADTIGISPDALVPDAFAAAQRLATAYADGDWTTARQISPLPEWTDETYEEGFAGLEASKLFLADSLTTGTLVDLWLAMVAHETCDSGPQTSLYCVHWAYESTSATIARVHGKTVLTDSGFAEPSTLQGEGMSECPHFDDEDTGSASESATQSEPVPQPTREPPPPADDQVPVGMNLITVGLDSYACMERQPGDFDCQQYYGDDIPTIFYGPDLWCSESSFGEFSCNDDGYYPSELDGYETATIDGQTVLCRSAFGDDQCWLWFDYESPSQAVFGPPNYVCERFGQCIRQ